MNRKLPESQKPGWPGRGVKPESPPAPPARAGTISASLASKLASVVVHVQEMLDPVAGHPFDRIALESVVNDPEVSAWIKSLGPLARAEAVARRAVALALEKAAKAVEEPPRGQQVYPWTSTQADGTAARVRALDAEAIVKEALEGES